MLDAAGGRGRTEAFVLTSGSLGQPFETAEAASGAFRVRPGLVAPPVKSPPPAIREDLDGNGRIDFADFVIFARGYGKSAGQEGYDPRLDLDGNGAVGFQDFLLFARAFGR